MKHDEKSSSFKRIRIGNFSDGLFARNINFDTTQYENECRRNKDSHTNKNEYFRRNNIFEGSNNSNKNKNFGIFNKNRQGIGEYDMNFSETEQSDYSGEEAEEVSEEEIEDGGSSHKKDSSTKKPLCCTCTKSRCLKKYCECYANKVYCNGCNCTNCYNLPKFKELIKRSLDNTTNRKDTDSCDENIDNNNKNEVLCNCTKSNCTKKYCECFKVGEGCKETCRCINCENNKEKDKIKKNRSSQAESETLNLNEEKRKENKNLANFVFEYTRVYIHNCDISITEAREIPKSINDENINIINHIKNSNNIFKIDPNNIQNSTSKRNSKIFEVNITNFNDSKMETPKVMNKKRKRIDKGDSIIKSNSTHFQTPLFSTSQKNVKRKLSLDEKVVKNLEKNY